MRFSMFLPAVVAFFLTACSGYAPSANPTGMTADQVIAQMGTPETRRTVEGGSRLEYPRGPFGKHTWFVYLDPTGRVVRTEQVLNERNFLNINPGMTQDEVRMMLGRPGAVYTLGRSRGVVWNYRYENPFCRWYQVEIDQEQKVRSAGYGEPPECRRRDRVPFP